MEILSKEYKIKENQMKILEVKNTMTNIEKTQWMGSPEAWMGQGKEPVNRQNNRNYPT